jgi:peptide/nickel transport system ATP-binding protein
MFGGEALVERRVVEVKNALSNKHRSSGETPLLEVQHLECAYEFEGGLLPFGSRRAKKVVHSASFRIQPSETFALVGESGSGKSTIARAIAGLLVPVGGKMVFGGCVITQPVEERSEELRREIQIIFQNPDSSLNPRRRVSYSVGRPITYFFRLSDREVRRRVDRALEAVRLDSAYAGRFPAELSGGERQRVAIARALAVEPSLLVCDEILSAVDVSVQASILELLKSLQEERGITYLFISHDLAVVRSLAHQVGVLYMGRLLEIGDVAKVFSLPLHPYTELLLYSVPEPTPGLHFSPPERTASGNGAGAPTSTCPFAPRCPRKLGPVCEQVLPPWQVSESGHGIRCHIPCDELTEVQALPWEA